VVLAATHCDGKRKEQSQQTGHMQIYANGTNFTLRLSLSWLIIAAFKMLFKMKFEDDK